ncbi:MAG: M28 family peptidase [Candidatus Sulfotelmatobacter sp.]
MSALDFASATMICALALFGSAALSANLGQNPTGTENKNTTLIMTATQRDADAIREVARNSTYGYEQVRFLSNNIGPRLSGSPQAAAAVTYIAQQMRELGLEVRLEPVTVPHWVRGREEAELVRYPGQVEGTSQNILVTTLGNAVATPEQGLTAPVLVIDSFEQLDELPADQVKGKIVLFNHHFDEFAAKAGRWEQVYAAAVQYRSKGPARAAKEGAVAALVRSVGSGRFRLAHTGLTKPEEGTPQIPAGAVPPEDADLISALAKPGPVEIHLVLTPRDLAPEQSYNVIADLTGDEAPKEVVVVSGHLDSWDLGTGALDDAIGIGVAMDAVRIIKSVCPHPKRTIRFVAWMNEENGVAGGRAYAQAHASELENHIAAIEIDYGDGRPLALNVAGTDEKVAPISKILNTIADPIGGVVRVHESPGTDIKPINEKGVTAISPLQEARQYFDYHHTAADTFDKVRIDEMHRVIEVIAPLVYALAQHE